MTVVSLLVSPLALARADERAASPLIERAPATERAAPNDRAIAWASWIPELRLRAIFDDARWPRHHAVETTVLGELIWPLDRTPVGSAVEAARLRRQRSSERQSLVDKIAAAWHERRRAEELGDDVAAELAREEADAELDAAGEDGP